MSKDYKARKFIGKTLRSPITPVFAFVASFGLGLQGLDYIYHEQPDNNRGPNYEASNNNLQQQYNALSTKIVSIDGLTEQLGYTSITEQEKFKALQQQIQEAKSSIDGDTNKLISNIYTNAELSENDTLDYIANLQSDGISDFADKFRDGTDINQWGAMPSGWENSLHDAHGYLRECRAEKAPQYNLGEDQYLNSVYSCMQQKDYDEIKLVDNPLSTLGIFLTYLLLIPLAPISGSIASNIVSKNKNKIKKWENGETHILPQKSKPKSH